MSGFGYTGELIGNIEERHRRGGRSYNAKPEDYPMRNGRTFQDIVIMQEAQYQNGLKQAEGVE